jgi:hypothetical protein
LILFLKNLVLISKISGDEILSSFVRMLQDMRPDTSSTIIPCDAPPQAQYGVYCSLASAWWHYHSDCQEGLGMVELHRSVPWLGICLNRTHMDGAGFRLSLIQERFDSRSIWTSRYATTGFEMLIGVLAATLSSTGSIWIVMQIVTTPSKMASA